MKPPTVVATIQLSTLERDENEINKCKTQEEIEAVRKRLVNELKELENKKKLGYDIDQQYEDLTYKYELAKEAKMKLEKREDLKKPNCLDSSHIAFSRQTSSCDESLKENCEIKKANMISS